MNRLGLWLGVLCLSTSAASGQQLADTAFHPALARPAFPGGGGPVVAIDSGHDNFHTAGGRYAPFAELLRRDGYRVRTHAGLLTAASLEDVDILVIANALHPSNRGYSVLPTPSAFDRDEVASVREWVEQGGSLLLIADHMPFAGAAADLAAAFGFHLRNGFAMDTLGGGAIVFRRADGGLPASPARADRPGVPRVDSVASFTGEAFTADPGAVALLRLPGSTVSLEPRIAWQFDSTTVRTPAGGLLQGAVRQVGRGRVAMLGEAAMFTAQLAGPQQIPMGMNAPEAGGNVSFLRNLLWWLAPH
ncbi:MAG: hypothetical protein AB7I33_14495 [Gemmatimonadales bacterium]